MTKMDLSDMTLDIAKTLVGTTFEVILPDGSTTTMILQEALPFHPVGRETARRQSFRIFLTGTPSLIVPQGTYQFRAENVCFEQLFIVPVGRNDQATEYEACFT